MLSGRWQNQEKDAVLHYLDLLQQPTYWHDGVTGKTAGMEGRIIKAITSLWIQLEADHDKAYVRTSSCW